MLVGDTNNLLEEGVVRGARFHTTATVHAGEPQPLTHRHEAVMGPVCAEWFAVV